MQWSEQPKTAACCAASFLKQKICQNRKPQKREGTLTFLRILFHRGDGLMWRRNTQLVRRDGRTGPPTAQDLHTQVHHWAVNAFLPLQDQEARAVAFQVEVGPHEQPLAAIGRLGLRHQPSCQSNCVGQRAGDGPCKEELQSLTLQHGCGMVTIAQLIGNYYLLGIRAEDHHSRLDQRKHMVGSAQSHRGRALAPRAQAHRRANAPWSCTMHNTWQHTMGAVGMWYTYKNGL